jgi:hypothetical protein
VGEVAMPDSTKMLPLIVGAIEEKEPTPVEVPVADAEPTPSEPEIVADGEVVALGGETKPE